MTVVLVEPWAVTVTVAVTVAVTADVKTAVIVSVTVSVSDDVTVTGQYVLEGRGLPCALTDPVKESARMRQAATEERENMARMELWWRVVSG